MTALAITFVFQRVPELPDRDLSTGPGYARFIEEFAQYTASPVRMLQDLHEAPDDGFVVFAGADVRTALQAMPADQQASLARRVVPINASQPDILEKLLEPFSFLAAIDTFSFLQWRRAPLDLAGARGLWGLRNIAPLIGASCAAFISQRYCHLESATHHGLPHLLADYLIAYQSSTSTCPT